MNTKLLVIYRLREHRGGNHLPIQVLPTSMLRRRGSSRRGKSSLRSNGDEQVRQGELRIHRMFQRCSGSAGQALLWQTFVFREGPRWELLQEETLPRGSQVLLGSRVPLRQRLCCALCLVFVCCTKDVGIVVVWLHIVLVQYSVVDSTENIVYQLIFHYNNIPLLCW